MKPYSLLLLVLLATLPACDYFDNHEPSQFENLDPDDVLMLTPDSAALVADGRARLTLTATIVPTNPKERMVTFTTSAGTLVGAKEGNLQILANEAGEATAVLKSSEEVGVAHVQASIGKVVRQVQVTFTPVHPDHILTLTAPNTPRLADARAEADLQVVLGPSATAAHRKVTFTTNVGTFGDTNMVSVDALLLDTVYVARAILRSSRVGTARISAHTGGFAQHTQLTFERTPPSALAVDAGAFALKADSTYAQATTVKVRLSSAGGGIASAGTLVKFTAFARDATGQNVVIPGFSTPEDGFRDIKLSDDKGEASAKFSVGGTPYRGIVRIYATWTSGTATLQASDEIRIIEG